jgi:hypothetical protein
MAQIDQDRLNERVIAAVDVLGRYLNDCFADIRTHERGRHCEIALVNPHDPNRPIEVSTADGEITVSFGECHEHFNGLMDGTDEAGLVVEMVAKVVLLAGGSEVSYSAWSGDNCLGGGWLRAGTGGEEVYRYFPQADRIKIVGWAPRNDAELRHSEPSPSPDDQ